MSFRIRLDQPSDDAEWPRMRRALWPHERQAAHRIDMAAWLAKADAVVLVAERADRQGLAGFTELGTRLYADGCETSPVAYLEGWYVERAVRHRKRL